MGRQTSVPRTGLVFSALDSQSLDPGSVLKMEVCLSILSLVNKNTLHFIELESVGPPFSQVPFDNLRLVFPPVPASIIMLLLYGAVIHLLPLSISRILFAGGLLGYIAYDMLHYYVHHGSPQYGSYLAGLKSYHIAHHYINYNLGWLNL